MLTKLYWASKEPKSSLSSKPSKPNAAPVLPIPVASKPLPPVSESSKLKLATSSIQSNAGLKLSDGDTSFALVNNALSLLASLAESGGIGESAEDTLVQLVLSQDTGVLALANVYAGSPQKFQRYALRLLDVAATGTPISTPPISNKATSGKTSTTSGVEASAPSGVPSASLELHGYQKDFLDTLGVKLDNSGPSAALEFLVGKAIADAAVHEEIYGSFHCVHCGSVKPAEWIRTRKGTKTPYALDLSAETSAFLGQSILKQVEKVGDPPVRQVVPGPLWSDASKAARMAVDWAIQNYDAAADGIINIPL